MSTEFERICASIGAHHFMVDDLQAAEPGELFRPAGEMSLDSSFDPGEAPRSGSPRPGVWVAVGDELDGMGFPRIEVRASTRELLLEFVEDNWGHQIDTDWFDAHVVDRILEIGGAPRLVATGVGEGLLGYPPRPRVATARYDVTDLDEGEVDFLFGELNAVAEECDGHQGVELLYCDFEPSMTARLARELHLAGAERAEAEEQARLAAFLEVLDGMVEATEEFIRDDGLRADDTRIHDLAALLRARDVFEAMHGSGA